MFPVTRLFESEAAAREAADKLLAAGVRSLDGKVYPEDITVISPYDPGAADQVDDLIARGGAMAGHRRALKEALTKGRSIVSVTPDYGLGSFVESTLNRSGAVDTDTIADYLPSDPAPFSGFLGLPVLTDGKSSSELLKFDKSSSFGLGLLSKKAAPFSSMFGLKLLSSKKGSIAKGSSVERMSGKPAPLSSMIGFKTLTTKKGSRSKGSSVERMSGKSAPFSAFLGLRVLSKRD